MSGKTLGEVAANDIGQTVRIRNGNSLHAGVLSAIEAGATWISEQAMTAPEPRVAVGRRWVRVTVDGWTSDEMRPEAPIEVLA